MLYLNSFINKLITIENDNKNKDWVIRKTIKDEEIKLKNKELDKRRKKRLNLNYVHKNALIR